MMLDSSPHGPLFVYGNWSSYDELSDKVPLDEELAMRQMRELLRLRSHGVRFDAYLMDAFWYARDGAYRSWRKPEWPDGPDRWLEACHENGLLPGLWFTANTLLELDTPPSWQDSVDAKNWGLCLFEGGFLEDYIATLDHWYERGIRLFKLDFADFDAVPAGKESEIDPAEARARNIEAFRNALREFRSAHPEALLLAFNGFEERECMERTDRPPGSYLDPAWLDVFDSIYCGDPRPADIPCASFWRAVDIYSDCMTRQFESSGIPLHRIDNCAFMAGNTGTCYWRGKSAWKGMLLLSLARGGSIHVAYGDLSLFTDLDAAWWASAQELYASGMKEGATTALGGWPGSAVPYGWLSVQASKQIVTVVNPGMTADTIELPQTTEPWRLLCADPGLAPVMLGSELILAGGQMAVLIASESELPALEMDESVGIVAGLDEIAAESIEFGGNSVTVTLPERTQGLVRVEVTQKAPNGDVLRTWPGDEDRYPFEVVVTSARGREELPRIPSRKVWSGLSWIVTDIEAVADTTIVANSTEPGEVSLAIRLFSI